MKAPLLSGVHTFEQQNIVFAVKVAAGLVATLLFFLCAVYSSPPFAASPLDEAKRITEAQGSVTKVVDFADHANLDNTTLVKAYAGQVPVMRSAFPGLVSQFSVPRSQLPVSCPVPAPSFAFPVARSRVVSHAAVDTQPEEDGKVITAEFTEGPPEPEVAAQSAAERAELKRTLLKLCASYDRGYGATPKARLEVDGLVSKLEALNPTPMNANRGVAGGPYSPGEAPPPLKGIWRMVWTSALDVLSLGFSPVALPGAIYQVIDPPIATNIIDFIPRPQALLPTSFPSTLVRAEVKTRTSFRVDDSNRVGLTFEAVKLVPVEVLGQKPDFLPPLNFNLPTVDVNTLPGVNPDTAPGYFDVLYLDKDMLIIKQNAPGGYFVLINVPDCDP